MDPYDTRDRVIEILMKYCREKNTSWQVLAPFGTDSYVLVSLPGPQNLSAHIEYKRAADDTDDTSDQSGMYLVKNNMFIKSPELGFIHDEGIYRNEIRNMSKLIQILTDISDKTKNVVVLESRSQKAL